MSEFAQCFFILCVCVTITAIVAIVYDKSINARGVKKNSGDLEISVDIDNDDENKSKKRK